MSERHDSYGMLSIVRCSGGSRSLFGSNIKHNNTILLRINKATVDTSLNKDWYNKKENIIEIEMSQLQYAEFLSSINSEGVPVTITKLNGNDVEPNGMSNIVKKSKDEFKDEMNYISNQIKNKVKDIQEALKKKNLNKKDKDLIDDVIREMSSMFYDKVPFAKQRFEEEIDRVVIEAKNEIEAQYMQQALKVGTENIKLPKIE